MSARISSSCGPEHRLCGGRRARRRRCGTISVAHTTAPWRRGWCLTRGSADALALLDRHLGTGARPLERLVGEEAGEAGDERRRARPRRGSPPRRASSKKRSTSSHATACMNRISPRKAKTPAASADGSAANQRRDLLGDLGLGERDLLADKDRDALGDVEDELGDRAIVVGRRRAAGLRVPLTLAGPLRRRRSRSRPRPSWRRRWRARRRGDEPGPHQSFDDSLSMVRALPLLPRGSATTCA